MTAPATTKSDAYEVSAQMLCARIGRTAKTLCAYQSRNFIPRGKRREGVRGIFFTVAQANTLMTRIGSKAERFSEF